jgi:hypothetical protein
MRRYAAVTDETLRRAAEAVAGNGHGMVRNGIVRLNRHECSRHGSPRPPPRLSRRSARP